MKIFSALLTGIIISSVCVHSQNNNIGKTEKNQPKVDVPRVWSVIVQRNVSSLT